MKKKLFFAAVAIVALASCSDNEFIGDNSPTTQQENAADEIQFGLNVQNTTRAGELVGATAAEKLGGMFVVEGTKGSEETSSPSTTVVFDNYLVGYTYNTAGKTESNTNNWEYVGLQSGITDRMTSDTWTALHSGDGEAKSQTIKYWDYTQAQYDFIAWSTGNREAVTTTAANGKVKVTRINTGETLKTNGFQMTAVDADDLLECYYTDIITVPKANYGNPVTLTFRNMAAKVRIALYETVPGYSVKDVKFYSAEAADPAAPADLGSGSTTATLFTTGEDVLPKSGTVTVLYPRIGSDNKNANPRPVDYNKASVTVSAGSSTGKTQTFSTLSKFFGKEANEADVTEYLGRKITEATFAGSAADDYYQAVIPNTNGKPLTLRIDYTLVATDGSGETINIYGAKAVVPSSYTNWLPNYAYTYIFKISDNTNGWTDTDHTAQGLFPITFDAVVTSFVDANAEQTTVTTVATPSITTYQQGHDHANKDEYSKTQKAGANKDADPPVYKDVYVQVMDNSGATPSLKADLNSDGKSLLFKVSKNNASEAEVMDALENRTNTPTGDPAAAYKDVSPVGRNGITLTKNDNISNTETSIVNGVDDQPITKIAGTAIAAGQVAKIDIDQLATGTYAYVYCTPPSSEEKVYNVASATEASANPTKYYIITLTGSETPLTSGTAEAGKVYFVKNVDKTGAFVSYTFKQTKVGESVVGLVEATISSKGTAPYVDSALTFYFDVYYKNNGKYAVKVIKVVD